jgi:hypothetical protein
MSIVLHSEKWASVLPEKPRTTRLTCSLWIYQSYQSVLLFPCIELDQTFNNSCSNLNITLLWS